MTKANMIKALTAYYPLTTTAYWIRHNTQVVKLNYDAAVAYYGLLPVARIPSPQASLAITEMYPSAS